MAVTKILAKTMRLDVLIRYAIDGDKTEEKIYTAYHNCTQKDPYGEMMDTKRAVGKTDGVQAYHIIQSFAAGTVSPEAALEIAKEYVRECIPEYQAVIGVHLNTDHIHTHIVFNSVNYYTGAKYHSNSKSYYEQIRTISDRVCREHGLSIIMNAGKGRAVNYYEWLREKRGLPTYRSMLEADLRRAIDDANDYGHFLTLMEHMGYEVKHGSRLSFRLRGQEHWFVPGRKNSLFTEDGIRQAIQGNLEVIEAGLRPTFTQRRIYTPYKKHPKYTGFLALYRHYLYLLGKIQKQEYPPRMTAHMKTEVMKFDKYKAQFKFLMDHNISTERQLKEYAESADDKITALTKQRTILNVKKKKRKQLYDALADAEALYPVAALYTEGMTGIEAEFARYMDAVKILDECGITKEALSKEKVQVYGEIAEINKEICELKNDLNVIKEIREVTPSMEKDIHHTENIKTKEVTRDDRSK